jgi:pimeloyl-ACP methyl ester carboxylesterase
MRLAILPLIVLPAGAWAQDLTARLDEMGAYPCADSSLTCVDIDVPLDHFADDKSETISITLAVWLASEPDAQTMFYTVGGPGGSGLAVAEDYVGLLDEDMQAGVNFVFFDQRGVGPVNGFDCPLTLGRFYATEMSLDDPDAAIATAQNMVTECLAEAPNTRLLPYLDTEQAIRDLEQFRQMIGVPQVWLYGESYGTQFSQQYATAFPDAVAGVILDGVIDLNLSYSGFNGSYVRAAERILDRVLNACLAEAPGCATDMPNPRATVTFNALYGQDGRAEFLRVLAAADRGNLVPILRMAYTTLGVDPVTLEGMGDPTWFAAAYYAVTCTDYGEEPVGDPMGRARAVIEDARLVAEDAPRLIRAYYEERLVCAFWPETGEVARPEPFAGGDYPTLILNGDADPITPITQSYSVLDGARNAAMVAMEGGPHVIYGRGLACPDQVVTDLVLDGVMPDVPVQVCRQQLVGYYEPLTLRDPALASPLDIARAVAVELYWHPDVYFWSGDEPLQAGCDFGGSISGTMSDKGTRYQLTDCSLWPGIVLTGTFLELSEDMPGAGQVLTVEVTGLHTGSFRAHDSIDRGSISITGTWNGATIDERPMP